MKKFSIIFFAVLIIAYIMPGLDKIKNLETMLKLARGEQRIEILIRLTEEYQNHYPQKVIDSGEEALTLMRKYPDKKQEAQLLNRVGRAYIDKGIVETGLTYLNRSRKLAEENSDPKGLADALYSIAATYIKFGNYDLAMSVNKKVLEIRTRLKDQRGIAESRRAIGRILSGKGEVDKALKSYMTALDIQEQINDKEGMAYTYLEIGEAYRQLKKYNEAGRYFKLALDIHKETENKAGILLSLNRIAGVLRDTAENTIQDDLRVTFYQETAQYYRQALNLQKTLGFKTDVVSVLLNMGDVYEKLNRHEKARESYGEALTLSRQLGEKSYEARTLSRIALMYSRLKQNRKALDTANQALDIAGSIPDKVARKKVYEDIATVYFTSGDFRKAYKYYRQFKSQNDEILNSETSRRIAALDTLLNIKEKERQIELLEEKEKRQTNLLHFYFIVGVLILIIAVINFILYRIKKREEAAVRESKEKYRQLEEERIKRSKLESISLLAGGIAHDFNNILGVILGYIELVKMSLSRESNQNQSLTKAEKAVNKAKDLVSQFIAVAENGEPVKQLCQVQYLVRNAIDQALKHPLLNSVHEPLNENLEIKVNIPEEIKPVNCNPDGIKQVFSNLLVNSIEAIYPDLESSSVEKDIPNEVIEISAKNIYLVNGQVGTLPAGPYVCISVKDPGEGIPQENIDKVFDPYFSTRKRVTQKGLGLGLTLVYSIVTRHGGHIDISSQSQKGTKVTLYLPIPEKEAILPLRN